jgi:acyl-CoA thioesterase-2
MGGPTGELVGLLDLEDLGGGRFRAPPVVSERSRLYGGQLVAQATMAAGRAAGSERVVHSVHAYFLRVGVVTDAIDFDVARVHESASFSIWRVEASQAGRALLTLTASFHVPEVGPELDVPVPTVAPPATLAPFDEWLLAQPDPATHVLLPYFAYAFDGRQATDTYDVDPGSGRGVLRERVRDLWVRTLGPLPDDPLVHACVVAYFSDKPALGTAVLGPPLHGDPGSHLVASLDHSLWFHRPCRADEWLLFRCETAAAGGGRAFGRMEIYDGGGIVASAAQEGLVRPMPG